MSSDTTETTSGAEFTDEEVASNVMKDCILYLNGHLGKDQLMAAFIFGFEEMNKNVST